MKLSQRLKQIDLMVSEGYDHIWDCCCDHGLLGATLLQRKAAPNIHFVDIVPDLMKQIKLKLERFFPHAESNWSTHCLDVAKLPLQEYSGRHLIIIAGVGGDLMTEFVDNIHSHNPAADIDFLLCPVHHQFTLRHKLIELNFSLNEERLIEDNQRFYEVLFVSSDRTNRNKINSVGNQIWHSNCQRYQASAEKYLQATLNHYKRIQSGKTQNVQHIIDAYSAVNINKAESDVIDI